MKRLAIVHRQVRGVTGTVTTILEHARRMSALGWSVDVVGEKLDDAAVRAAGASPRAIWGLPFGGGLKRRYFAWRADSAVSEGFDLVHGHGDNFRQDVLSLHNCVHAAHEFMRGAPLPPGGVGEVHERQLRERLFKVLIANSKLMRDDLAKRFQIPESAMRVIHPGHDPARFNPAVAGASRRELRQKLGFLETDVVFGLITSGDFEKRGVEGFISALGYAAARLKGVLRAIIMGKEAHLGNYRRLVSAENLSEIVVFLPPSTEVEKFYGALDAYVHPAHFEEFGQSVQEALACGLPVLTNRRVGASELMSGEALDYILDAPDAQALAGQMCVLAGDRGLRERLSAAGPESVKRNTWDANFAATLAVYEQVLKKS